MLKNIRSLKLQGSNFLNPALLEFKGKQNKSGVSIIYGRNGAGKSTIAKAFRKIKGDEIETIRSAVVLDDNGAPVVLSDEERDRIFVFDEDYVNKNILVQADGLSTIVMLGEQVDLTSQIERAEEQLKQAKIALDKAESNYKELCDSTNSRSPSYLENVIAEKLKGDNRWAGRDRKIRGKRQNTKVVKDTYKTLISLKPTRNIDELYIEYANKLSELERAESGAEQITEEVPSLSVSYFKFCSSIPNELIKEKIEKPVLNEREKYLLSLASSGGYHELECRSNKLKNEEMKFCPYCLQDLSEVYKGTLIDMIEEVLDDKISEHIKQLSEFKTEPISLNLSAFEILKPHQKCIILIEEINGKIIENNDLLQRKIDNVYSPIIDTQLYDIVSKCESLEDALQELAREKDEHNRRAIATDPIKEKLIEINDHIAHLEIKDDVEIYEKQEGEKEKARIDYRKAQDIVDSKKRELNDLNSKRKCVDIAIDVINESLKYIFFADNRLCIRRDGEYYKLLSKGHDVFPSSISLGERNILGLCYFFASMMAGKSRDMVYKDECFLVIDDPVSSFDFENKVGIFSFLNYKLREVFNGNKDSFVMIMSHDLQTFYDLEKTCKDISALKGHCLRFKLSNCQLAPFAGKEGNQYTYMLNAMYKYASGSREKNCIDPLIGNMMRQVLEAYGTFTYRQGVEVISTDPNILAVMSPEYHSYFQGLMYRLLLHGGSHRREQVECLQIDFFSCISDEEKRRTARDIICFLYLLNKAHVIAHLDNKKTENQDPAIRCVIEEWCEDIKNSTYEAQAD